ncbi:MAG: hypothetical protein WD772_05075 [Pseudohongiellaceae bacterium]
MAKPFLMMIAGLLLAACAYSDGIPNFEAMGEVELAEYNSSRPLGQMIVCSEENRNFSRVRRRRCATVEQMYGSVEQADQLNVLNSIPGYIDAGN